MSLRIQRMAVCGLLMSAMHYTAFAQQTAYVGEDDMSPIFVSGGYGALFGAAMGAALLPFLNGTPTQNLRVVAGGASIGFMAGSLYGFYSLARAKRNSYFNYTTIQDDDNNYYSMPPTIPTDNYQGSLFPTVKQPPAEIPEEKPSMPFGALVNNAQGHVGVSFPCFWIQDQSVVVWVASLRL